LYDPETEAEGFQTYRAWRLHWDCAECQPVYCAEYVRLSEAVRTAVQRKLTPYRVTHEGGDHGAWNESTASAVAQHYRGTISKSPVSGLTEGSGRVGIQHTENIAELSHVWLTEDEEGKWLNIGVTTSGGIRKTLRLAESEARWLRASVIDTMRRLVEDGE
jgi:hypothetical protein